MRPGEILQMPLRCKYDGPLYCQMHLYEEKQSPDGGSRFTYWCVALKTGTVLCCFWPIHVRTNREWKHNIQICQHNVFFMKTAAIFIQKNLHRMNAIFGIDTVESVQGSNKVVNCIDYQQYRYQCIYSKKMLCKVWLVGLWSCLQAYVVGLQVQMYDILCIVIK